jgi:hypothetical protein
METIIRETSINGRNGLEIIGSEELKGRKIFRGTLVSLGRSAGVSCFRVDPGSDWIVVGGDLAPVEGAGSSQVAREDLQGNSFCTVLTVQEGGIYRKYEYKRRGLEYRQIINGEALEVSPAFLLDAGIIMPAVAPVPVVTAPPFNAAFAAALAKISK